MADDLSAQGSGLRARQTKRRPHAPEEHTPTPGANLRVDINFLAKGREEEAGLSVGKEVQQPRQFTVDASGRGDDRRQEGVTQTVSLATPAISVNFLLSPLRKLEVNVLMAQGAIRRGVRVDAISVHRDWFCSPVSVSCCLCGRENVVCSLVE